MFEDSCNFMHNVSVKCSADPIFIHAPLKATPPGPPVVNVHPPRSVRSPPRSPRMSDLLFVLRDVIGDEQEETPDTLDGTTSINDSNAPESDSTSIHSLHSFNDETAIGNSAAGVENTVPTEDATLCMPPDSHSSVNSSPAPEHLSVHHTVNVAPSNLLSPVNLSQLNLTAFALSHHKSSSKDGDSIDSGYADTWTAPQPFVRSPPRSPLNSTFDLLSSPFGPPSSRVLSPRLSAFISRPPASPFGLSPSIVDDPSDLSLDSLEEDSSDMVVVDDSPSNSPGLFEVTGNSVTDEDVEEGREGDIIGHGPTSGWDYSGDQKTVVYLGMPPLTPEEVNDAILHSSTTPTHFLAETINFVDDEANTSFSAASRSPSTPSTEGDGESGDVPLHSSSKLTEREGYFQTDMTSSHPARVADEVRDDVEEQNLSDSSFTAQLAYPTSPTVPLNENDTLNFIYDDYSSISNERDTSTVLNINTDTTPPPETAEDPLSAKTPVGRVRARVFTPPLLHRGHSDTVVVDSPTSLSSPSDAARASRFSSHSRETRSVWSPDSSLPDMQEVPQSKKIPFGFRHSRPVDHARNFSFNSNHAQHPSALASKRTSSSQSDRAFSPNTSSPLAGGLRPLKLASILGPVPSSAPSGNSHFSFTSNLDTQNINRLSMSSTTVSSESSISRNPLLSSARSSPIPTHIRNTLFTSQDISTSLSSHQSDGLSKPEEPLSAPIPNSQSWHRHSMIADDLTSAPRDGYRLSSRFSEPSFGPEDEDNGEDTNYDHIIRWPLPTVSHTAPVSRRTSITYPPMYAIATPPPTLMFAIASDDVDQVRQVLEHGDAGPNDLVGPQSALAFALTNDQLAHKIDIVKTLLAYGADPTVLKNVLPPRAHDDNIGASPHSTSLTNVMDPAIRYYVERADTPHTRRTSALIHQSFFRPLTRVQYELIGQDRALEQLFRVLSIHSRQLSVTPIVVLLCGPSGHGKSLLARKFGSLLDVPTHTVNMTVLKSTQDLWQSYSMSPYEAPTTCTLAEFLINNEGKRCVVVLDEIEKTHDEKTLWSLLMPWELGRCALEASGCHVDVQNVVWLGTSNVGHDLVFEHHEARAQRDEVMSREEYVELMGLFRPRVSERLGASILSRVTTVLPFVPFTSEEKRAICFEALHTIAGDVIRTLPTDVADSMVDGALASYASAEGARSLYRSVSNQLVDNI